MNRRPNWIAGMAMVLALLLAFLALGYVALESLADLLTWWVGG